MAAHGEELVTLRRWSGRAFLYRKEGKVAGVYWPDLRYRRAPNDEHPVHFIHTFGRFDPGPGTVSELISVDDHGGVLRFSDVGPCFSMNAPLIHGTDPRTPPPRTPHDWLRHEVHVFDQLLSPEHPQRFRAPGD